MGHLQPRPQNAYTPKSIAWKLLAGFFSIALLATAPASAQSVLAGSVSNADGEPLAGAQLTIRPLLDAALRFQVETGDDGRYRFENFNPSRAYRFEVVLDGYRPQTRDVEVGSAGVTLGSVMRQDFTLFRIGTSGGERSSSLVMMSRQSAGVAPYQKGVRAFERGDLEKARARLESARKLDPSLIPVHATLAQVYYQLGELDAALEAADQALEAAPWDPIFLRIRYDALNSSGQREAARETLHKLAQAAADRGTAGLFHNDGVAALREGNLEDALVLLEIALRLEPELTQAKDALAKVYFEQGRYESALAASQEVLEVDPTQVELWRLRHQAWKALGNTEKTLAALDDLVQRDPGSRTATLIYNEGVAAFNASDDATAAALFERGLALDDDNLQLLVGLAEVRLRQREFEACLEVTTRIEAIDPGNGDANRIATRAKARMGNS